MNNLIDSVKRTFGQARPQAQQLTRAQARKLILERIGPLLKREGFVHRKGNNLWRITEHKTDVIELRFLTLEEHQQFKIPQSTFSINYGCYYHFIPDIYEGKFTHQIPELITPLEAVCHYRMQATRSIKQKPKKMDMGAWHLDETEERQQLVLNDVIKQLESEVFLALNRLMDINEWVRFLVEEEGNLGTGKKDSLIRHFLLSFTYKSINDTDKSKTHLLVAKKICEKIIDKRSKHPEHLQLQPDSDFYKYLGLLNKSLSQQ
ncbi:MAG TPA: hypothetical protein ENI74_08515 [Gammaproteobacteria bacterium]|nr:hypothetical protein [Gammaproteobacteria bacterium]